MLEEKEYLNLFKPNFKYIKAKITNQFYSLYMVYSCLQKIVIVLICSKYLIPKKNNKISN